VLAALAEQAARLCKADLVSATVGEFPEVQGIAGAYLARVAGLDPQVADAIRDHYKPVGQGDDVPTAPVSVAVALADKLDTLVGFFAVGERPTGSRDPFALRRAAIGILALQQTGKVPFLLARAHIMLCLSGASLARRRQWETMAAANGLSDEEIVPVEHIWFESGDSSLHFKWRDPAGLEQETICPCDGNLELYRNLEFLYDIFSHEQDSFCAFFQERIKVLLKEEGYKIDIVYASIANPRDTNLAQIRMRAKALQEFISTPAGFNLLAGVKRASNILRIEEEKLGEYSDGITAETNVTLFTEIAETALSSSLDTTVPAIADAVEREDFVAAMAALAALRPAVDAFFDSVIVNAPDAAIRANRLGLLSRLRAAANSVADFSKVEG
jgi:glycyl-tRNA synthetase beta chain